MWKQAPEQACVERRRTSARSTKAPTSSRCPALAECQRSPKPDSRWKKYSNPCRHVEAPLPPHFNVEPGQTWAWLLQGFDYFFHSPDLSPGSEQHCSRGEGGTRSSRVRIFLPSTVPVVGASVDAERLRLAYAKYWLRRPCLLGQASWPSDNLQDRKPPRTSSWN